MIKMIQFNITIVIFDKFLRIGKTLILDIFFGIMYITISNFCSFINNNIDLIFEYKKIYY